MSTISSNEIISILKEEIQNFDFDTKDREVGTVIWSGDGIVTVYGIDHAMYGEVVVFENGEKGMVQDVRSGEIGVILFGSDSGVGEGSKVSRTQKMAGLPVGEECLGRVINALGAAIDGNGEIETDNYRPIEQPAPGIVERQSVSVPMETGILSIDSMFPIGRGQRELIIGDRQTGKTAIATDAIINQKGNGVICIYVAIGQKASTVAKLVNNLKEHGAMENTIVVAAMASDPAPLQYIAPYAGAAMGEFFMHQGKDVLIVFDDLSKHAVAYRALSLLLERSPGREAYPGDVFYLHSRLLERSSRLSEDEGGGSMTALPIIETQAGDVSAYIPTNVISITDGQIFLETDLFFSGMRPAVNVGLSVSRVGGDAQTKAMKKAAGSIRIDLAQYREMQSFTQFSSDLDEGTKEQLQYGNGLMELLKQPQSHPLSMAQQVITLWCATHKLFLNVEIKNIKKTQMDMLEYFSTYHQEIIDEITEKKELSDELGDQIIAVAKEFKESIGIPDIEETAQEDDSAVSTAVAADADSGDDKDKKDKKGKKDKKETKEEKKAEREAEKEEREEEKKEKKAEKEEEKKEKREKKDKKDVEAAEDEENTTEKETAENKEDTADEEAAEGKEAAADKADPEDQEATEDTKE